MLARIDEEGLICHSIENGYINTEAFMKFLNKLRKCLSPQFKYSIIMDNLSLHST